MNYAVYNKTTNEVLTIVTAPQGAIPEGYEFIEEDKLPPGWTMYVEPPVSPESVSMWAFKAAAKLEDKLHLVDSIITQLPEPDKTIATYQWEYATVIERQHPTTVAIGAALGLTESEIDALFIKAAEISGQ